VKSYYVECFWARDNTYRVWYRFQCRCCPLNGELQVWLSDAEDEGERHIRNDHGEGRAVA
jgi:hypothetical protein